MSSNNDKNEKTELKDLFTIDELIKESKRKDSEREKESQKNSSEEDEELNEIKESIKRRKENPGIDDKRLEQVGVDTKETKEETINDLINETTATEETEAVEEPKEIESPVTQKDIEEAINTAANENEEKVVESLSESKNITDVLLDLPEEENEEQTQIEQVDEIKEEDLKEPKKIDEERKESKYGAEASEEVYDNDLDYRKDLAKFTNTIKKSKIFQDVKEKLTPEEEEIEPMDESFIRNVNEYEDDFAPIINERHLDYDATYEEYHSADIDQRLRQENTRKVFNMAKNSPEPETTKQKVGSIKQKPERDNIKLQLNNNEVVLKKGDEIIFNHKGETYSSQVYAINGDDISVKYRRKNIKIKPSDVKKIY